MDTTAQNGDKLPIEQFSLGDMCKNPSILMIAKRGSGKSWITKAILQKYCDIPVGLVISPTERDDPFFSDFFPDTYIFYKYESKIIKKLLIRQKIMLKKMREKKREGKYIDPRGIIVMDDCLADKGSWAKDPLLYDLLFNGRHRQITYILTMQYVLGIKPELRSNFDYIFLLAEDYISVLKRIYEHYAGMFPDFNSFRQIFKQLTEDYGAMVIKKRSTSNNLFDKVCFYKAPDLQNIKFIFGCKQFIKYDEKNYNAKWEDDELQIDYDKLLMENKKNKTQTKIKKLYRD